MQLNEYSMQNKNDKYTLVQSSINIAFFFFSERPITKVLLPADRASKLQNTL